jgi:DHA1 family inner membrane transport protein
VAVLLVYVLFFDLGVGQVALVPLLPRFVEELSLSGVETGALAAVASVAMIVLALPIGMLADRLGARVLTMAAAGFLAAGSLGQGLAPDYWTLLASRSVFGVGHAVLWTAAIAWLSDLVPDRRRAAVIGATTPVSGLGYALGPVFAGFTAERLGVVVPFAAVAAVAVAALAGLVAAPRPGRPAMERPTLGRAREAVRRDPRARAGLAAMLLTGFVFASGALLLAPLALGDNGLSEGAIGSLLTVAGVVSVVVGGLVARLGERLVTVRAALVFTALLTAALVLPVLSTGTWPLLGFLIGLGVAASALSTIAYPLGVHGAHAAGVGRGGVVGLMNLCYGCVAVTGPILCGALAGAVGLRAGFAAVLAWSGLTLAVLAGDRWRLVVMERRAANAPAS